MKNRWLFVILLAAFFLRIIGIWYGLPFRISLDELGPVYGALKMIELKTLIPAMHPDIFNFILQYPPYMSYIYMPVFLVLIAAKFIQFLLLGGSLTDFAIFKLFLVADQSIFFMAARAVSSIFGLATVFLIYKISKNIFNNEKIALFSSAFLAFSFLHVSFSHAARHWIYVTFFFALVMFALSHPAYSVKKRYILALFFAGLGAGFNYQAGLSVFFIALWFLFVDKFSIAEFFKEKWIYKALGLFLLLSALAIALHPKTTGTDGVSYMPENAAKWSMEGLLQTYGFYLNQIMSVEFIFLFFIALGLLVLFIKKRGYFFAGLIFILFYILPFYFVYRVHDSGRYLLMLYPVFAISAGYGLYFLHERLLKILPNLFVSALIFSTFLFMIFVAAKFDYLLAKKDTRVQVVDWIEKNIPKDAKLITLVPFMRLPAIPEAIDEQLRIDHFSVSQTDRAISVLPGEFYPRQRFYSINLYKVKNKNFISDVGNYAKGRNFDYLVYDQDPALLENEGALNLLDIDGEIIKVIEGFSGTDGDVNNDFVGGIKYIIKSKNNGPTIAVKKINQ